MKKHHAWIVYTCLGASALFAADRVKVEPVSVITAKGPHHRIVETTSWEVMPGGDFMELKSKRIDLAAGLNFWVLRCFQWLRVIVV